jgi:hypothetical protein
MIIQNNKLGAIWLRNHPRLGGIIAIIFCWSVVGLWYNEVISKAQKSVPWIGIPAGVSFMLSMGFLGLALLLGGRPIAERLQNFKKQSKDPIDWSLIGFIILPGLLFYFWINSKLSSLGYF